MDPLPPLVRLKIFLGGGGDFALDAMPRQPPLWLRACQERKNKRKKNRQKNSIAQGGFGGKNQLTELAIELIEVHRCYSITFFLRQFFQKINEKNHSSLFPIMDDLAHINQQVV